MTKQYCTYDEMKLKVVQESQYPNHLVALAAALTQKKDLDNLSGDTTSLIKYLLKAGHTSIFEHASITILITGISRSLWMQILETRIASHTASSQHYQKYDVYPNILHPEMVTMESVLNVIQASDQLYRILIDEGVAKEEARQILVGAKGVNALWTINARALIHFIMERTCRRNVTEMQMFARRLKAVCRKWWPELFDYTGPHCKMTSWCNQGHMQAEVCKENKIPRRP